MGRPKRVNDLHRLLRLPKQFTHAHMHIYTHKKILAVISTQKQTSLPDTCHQSYTDFAAIVTVSKPHPHLSLFDRDPKRIGLCLHVLSRVVRDTVPGFSGPFLSQLDGPSPCSSGGDNSALSAEDDTSRESSTCCVEHNNDDHPHRERPSSHAIHPCLLYTSPSPRDKRQSRMPSSA